MRLGIDYENYFGGVIIIMIMVSVAVKNGLSSVLIADNGYEMHKHTYKLQDDCSGSVFKSLLDGLHVAVKYLKQYVESNLSDTEIIFECNNSIVVKWFKQGYAKEDYQPEFINVLRLLDEIPCRYSFQVNKKPFAVMYLSDKYIEKPRLSGVSFMEGIEDA